MFYFSSNPKKMAFALKGGVFPYTKNTINFLVFSKPEEQTGKSNICKEKRFRRVLFYFLLCFNNIHKGINAKRHF